MSVCCEKSGIRLRPGKGGPVGVPRGQCRLWSRARCLEFGFSHHALYLGRVGTYPVAHWLILPANPGDMGLIPGLERFHLLRSNQAGATAAGAWASRPCALQQEKPQQRGARASVGEETHLVQWEKARTKQRRPRAARNKLKKKSWGKLFSCPEFQFLHHGINLIHAEFASPGCDQDECKMPGSYWQ